MSRALATQAGTALFWKTLQHGGDNLIYLLRLVILARLLTPDDFGLLAIALTGFVPLLVITDFGLIPALVQKSDVTERHYNTAWTVGVFRALLISSVVFFAAPLIAGLFGEPRATSIIRALSVLPLLEATASIKLAALVRTLRFRSLALARLFQALANTIVSIALARSFGVWALVAGSLAGPLTYALLSYALAPHAPRICFDRTALRSLIHYGRWILVTGLISITAAVALRVAISRQLGVTELGLYSIAAKLAFLPHDVASEIVGAVAFPVYARLQSNVREASRAFRTTFTAMMLALTPALSLMIVLAPSLVTLLLGPQWEGAAPLIRCLAAVSLLRLIADATVPVLKGLGQPHKLAVLEGVQTILLLIVLSVLIDSFGLVGAAYAWLPAGIGAFIVSIIFLKRGLDHPFLGLARSLTTVVLASATGALTAFFLVNSLFGILGFSFTFVAAIASIALVFWICNKIFPLELAEDFARVFPRAAALLPGFGR